MRSAEWTDQQKWIMGIVASLTIAALTAIGAHIFSRLAGKKDLTPFPNGVKLLSIPQVQKKAVGRIEAIHMPKGRRNLKYRYYDVFLANTTDQPLTLVTAIVDTRLVPASGLASQEGDPVFPSVSYKFIYHPEKKQQDYPLQKPFRVKPKGVGALRLQLVPNDVYWFSELSLRMNIRLVDALGGEYYIIREFQ